MVAVIVLLPTGAATPEPLQERADAAEQVILRLMYQPAFAAIEDYYGEHRQYLRQEILNIQMVPESPYYEVVIQVETFHGAHNPSYGLETMTFYIGPLNEVPIAAS